ncbi:MAG: ATPase, T2SS/T4P/T4SS family [Bdellovibrionales bacterium]|jgi:type II secretory ATPase GspE/PulE/Tfp pilus assembly ATPase PilB-like protein|nr:ATPase, T2SS/T4P/T4SS family [Bdellovibrionales bacterium]
MDKVHTLRPPAGRPSNAIEVVDYVISQAIKLKASDIHLSLNVPTAEYPERHLLRYRVHGKLQIMRSSFLTSTYAEAVSRLKVLAEMPNSDTSVPQDGQLTVDTGQGQKVVLRISTIPSQGAEEVVIRIQRSGNHNLTINQLQMTEDMRARLKSVVQQKSGLIILNGPAGSGKTTTIYAIINTLASPERKIITAEDPVESRLPFVNHTQVSAKAGFAALSRAFMRQDADVIFLGEIRDQESALTAMQLAQTGHLVVTTLHSRDAVGVISRLEALDIHPNNIATTLICSLGQRLIPSLCAACKQPIEYDATTLAMLNDVLEIPPDTVFYEAGEGCGECIGGYSGRVPLFELFVVDSEVSDAINNRESKSQLAKIARDKGMSQFAEEALLRLYYGYTDLPSIQTYIPAIAARLLS